MKNWVIAVDGPAASGKGTLARSLGERLGFDVLDTGLLYRAVARQMLDLDLIPGDAKAATRVAQDLALANLQRTDLRGEKVGQAASVCSAHSGVRAALLQFQVDFANHPPGGKGAILDGRDIGTAVCPDAQVKLWITASPDVRAQRRFDEAQTKGDVTQSVAEIAASIAERDERERTRAISPMVPAEDAVVIDTSALSVGSVMEQALKAVVMRAFHTMNDAERGAFEAKILQHYVDEPAVPKRRRELR